MRIFKILLIILFTILVGIQFIRIETEVPAISADLTFDQVEHAPTEVIQLLKLSCYDCHSYETKYPWYADLAPISWQIEQHIRMGRADLNFSIWGNYSDEKKNKLLIEIKEEIEQNEMPLESYIYLHQEAAINDLKKDLLFKWLKKRRADN